MRYTFNLKKAYDDYYLYSPNTVYGTGERPRSEYVSPYKENLYIPEHNITKRMCYNKLGEYEDIDKSPKHLAKVNKALEAIKRNPILIISLLTNNATYKHVVDVTTESERPTQEEWDLLREVLL